MAFQKFLDDGGAVGSFVKKRFCFWIAPERETRDLDFSEIDGAGLASFGKRSAQFVGELVGDDATEMFRRNLGDERPANQLFQDARIGKGEPNGVGAEARGGAGGDGEVGRRMSA